MRADTTPQQPVLPPDRLFGEDKWTHFLVSALATAVSAAGAEAAGLDDDASLAVGAGAGLTLGVGKELWDRTTPTGRPSALDLLWDAAGVGLGVWVASQGR